jgi:hypothetical protein
LMYKTSIKHAQHPTPKGFGASSLPATRKFYFLGVDPGDVHQCGTC